VVVFLVVGCFGGAPPVTDVFFRGSAGTDDASHELIVEYVKEIIWIARDFFRRFFRCWAA
jgi:hypothetical protein